MAVTRKTLQLEQRVRAGLAKILDTQEAELVTAWATAWDSIAPELTALLEEMLAAGDGVTRSQLLRSERMIKALAVIADSLDGLFEQAKTDSTDDLKGLVDEAGQAQAAIVASQLPRDGQLLVDLESWGQVSTRSIDAIVKRTTKRITSQLKPLPDETEALVRRELIRGVAEGAHPSTAARRIVAKAGDRFMGGRTRALNITRTEQIDAHRTAAELGQAQHDDVLTGWVWLAQLTSRTCPACLSRHGSLHPLSEPGPQGHQQCRCARLPQTMSWADLGFPDLDEPDSVIPDAGEFFDSLTADQQQTILGPSRYAAWTAGRFPMEKWAVKQSNAGWRDSWVVAQAPKIGGGRSAA